MNRISKIDPKRVFSESGLENQASALTFWQWAYSDIQSNTTRGVLAEFLVAWALGLLDGARLSWASYDLLYKRRLRVEVKATAYVQTWEHGSKRPAFHIRQTRDYNFEKGYFGKPRYNAHVYVLCLFSEKDKERADPMNLNQWKFWVLRRADIKKLFKEGRVIKTEYFEEKFRDSMVGFSGLRKKVDSLI